MRYKILPILILILTAALTFAAIEFLPYTLHFPVVESSTPEDIQMSFFKNGHLGEAICKQEAAKVATAVRTSCPACKVIERCLRGLNTEHRKILSREPVSMPSARMAGGKLTMTFASKDLHLALGVCQQTERQSASLHAGQRLRCHPALLPR